MRSPKAYPEAGDMWVSTHPLDIGKQETLILLKQSFNERVSKGWLCLMTTANGKWKVILVDDRAIGSWMSSDKYFNAP